MSFPTPNSQYDVVTQLFSSIQAIINENVVTISGDPVQSNLGYPDTALSETGSLPSIVVTQVSPSFIQPIGFGNYIITTGSQWHDILSGSAHDVLGIRIIFSAQVDIWARNPRERNSLAGQTLEALVYPSSSPDRDYYEETGSSSPQIQAGIYVSYLRSMYDIDNKATNVSTELPMYQTAEPIQVYRKVMNYELTSEYQWPVFQPLIGQILIQGAKTGSAYDLVIEAVWSILTGSEAIDY